MKPKIGFVGLGIMGKPMVLNLLKAGFTVTVWNRTQGKAAECVSAGAAVEENLRELPAASDVIITMVNDTADVEEVLFSANGLASGSLAGKTVIDMSTISPDATEEFARRLSGLGCAMLDAPVSGGDVGARNASLTIMAGGSTDVFEQCRPIFSALGKKVVLCGSHGAGQQTKMINQVLCGIHAVALAEAMVLSDALGLDAHTTLEVVSSGAAGSWALSNYGPRILNQDLEPGFRLKMQQKDLRIAGEALSRLGPEPRFPATKLAFRLFTEALDRGLGELGSHGLIRLYRDAEKESV